MHVERGPAPRRSMSAARWPCLEVYPAPAPEVRRGARPNRLWVVHGTGLWRTVDGRLSWDRLRGIGIREASFIGQRSTVPLPCPKATRSQWERVRA